MTLFLRFLEVLGLQIFSQIKSEIALNYPPSTMLIIFKGLFLDICSLLFDKISKI